MKVQRAVEDEKDQLLQLEQRHLTRVQLGTRQCGEVVRGPTLHAAGVDADVSDMRRRRPTMATIKVVTRGLTAGLSHVHDRRLVHRNIMSQNVLLSGQDVSNDVILADFDVARLLKEEDSELM
ncbi:hypothetical protein BGX23_005480 [Mortierella sp. AD031]|nr:hypothetical protein BGX23_005480 [Mortierella sp. AD031]